MDISTSVLSSPRNQTDLVRSIALPNPKSPSEKFLFEKRSVLYTCTADWAAHSSLLLGDVFSLSLSVSPGEFRKSCRWQNQAVGIMSHKTVCLWHSALLLSLPLFLPSLSFHDATSMLSSTPKLTLLFISHLQIKAESQTMCEHSPL